LSIKKRDILGKYQHINYKEKTTYHKLLYKILYTFQTTRNLTDQESENIEKIINKKFNEFSISLKFNLESLKLDKNQYFIEFTIEILEPNSLPSEMGSVLKTQSSREIKSTYPDIGFSWDNQHLLLTKSQDTEKAINEFLNKPRKRLHRVYKSKKDNLNE
jgi:hypothetical protein